ncbi:MAG: type II toxin-antitoxin system VapB family antitoxin [Candidatus Dormibacteria bacterium]
MRTTLDLDDALVDALMVTYPGVSKTEAIENAVRGWLQGSASQRLRALAGKLDLEDRSSSMRRADRTG